MAAAAVAVAAGALGPILLRRRTRRCLPLCHFFSSVPTCTRISAAVADARRVGSQLRDLSHFDFVGIDVKLLHLLDLAQVFFASPSTPLSMDVPRDTDNCSDEAEEGETPAETVGS